MKIKVDNLLKGYPKEIAILPEFGFCWGENCIGKHKYKAIWFTFLFIRVRIYFFI